MYETVTLGSTMQSGGNFPGGASSAEINSNVSVTLMCAGNPLNLMLPANHANDNPEPRRNNENGNYIFIIFVFIFAASSAKMTTFNTTTGKNKAKVFGIQNWPRAAVLYLLFSVLESFVFDSTA